MNHLSQKFTNIFYEKKWNQSYDRSRVSCAATYTFYLLLLLLLLEQVVFVTIAKLFLQISHQNSVPIDNVNLKLFPYYIPVVCSLFIYFQQTT